MESGVQQNSSNEGQEGGVMWSVDRHKCDSASRFMSSIGVTVKVVRLPSETSQGAKDILVKLSYAGQLTGYSFYDDARLNTLRSLFTSVVDVGMDWDFSREVRISTEEYMLCPIYDPDKVYKCLNHMGESVEADVVGLFKKAIEFRTENPTIDVKDYWQTLSPEETMTALEQFRYWLRRMPNDDRDGRLLLKPAGLDVTSDKAKTYLSYVKKHVRPGLLRTMKAVFGDSFKSDAEMLLCATTDYNRDWKKYVDSTFLEGKEVDVSLMVAGILISSLGEFYTIDRGTDFNLRLH